MEIIIIPPGGRDGYDDETESNEDHERPTPSIDEARAALARTIAHLVSLTAETQTTIFAFDLTGITEYLVGTKAGIGLQCFRGTIPNVKPGLRDLQEMAPELQTRFEIEAETWNEMIVVWKHALSLNLDICGSLTSWFEGTMAKLFAIVPLSALDPSGLMGLQSFFEKMPNITFPTDPVYLNSVHLIEDIAYKTCQRTAEAVTLNHHLNCFCFYSFTALYHYSLTVRYRAQTLASSHLKKCMLSFGPTSSATLAAPTTSTAAAGNDNSAVATATIIPRSAGEMRVLQVLKDESKRKMFISRCKQISEQVKQELMKI